MDKSAIERVSPELSARFILLDESVDRMVPEHAGEIIMTSEVSSEDTGVRVRRIMDDMPEIVLSRGSDSAELIFGFVYDDDDPTVLTGWRSSVFPTGIDSDKGPEPGQPPVGADIYRDTAMDDVTLMFRFLLMWINGMDDAISGETN